MKLFNNTEKMEQPVNAADAAQASALSDGFAPRTYYKRL